MHNSWVHEKPSAMHLNTIGPEAFGRHGQALCAFNTCVNIVCGITAKCASQSVKSVWQRHVI